MTNAELLRTIRQHKGRIFVELNGINDVHYVRVVKRDLLQALALTIDGELAANVTRGDLYIERPN